MLVLPFAYFRFTPQDLADFSTVSTPKLEAGLWASIVRETGRESDRLLIYFPGLNRPVFSFERDEYGLYYLWYHDRSGLHGIGNGKTAVECLAVWQPRLYGDKIKTAT